MTDCTERQCRAPADDIAGAGRGGRAGRALRRAILLLFVGAGLAFTLPAPVHAAPGAEVAAPMAVPREAPQAPAHPAARRQPVERKVPRAPKTSPPSINLNINGTNPDGSRPASSLVIVLGLTLLSVAPALLLLCTCFTKVFMVLGITRNALGLTTMPPNQVIAGLALFLSLFIMGPTVSQMNDVGVQPYLKGDKTQSQAFTDGIKPLRDFMWKTTREDELGLLIKVSGAAKPANRDAVPLTTLVPAFVLSELRAAFIIGFVIFIPFLIIDLVVSASLMSLGMMMLPPVTVALPFKLLLFVLVNGWGLIITALVGSYRT
ncbi:flagellar type III secretion system pore protein FliP [Actinoplanes oblitus]|uniref:Flagellar biosynthetic protein FliP n=1 Tax=Actinoplanes oblitus TaxID=3040509 RepID=A0ABY8WGU2_9ACTN|nr:flagellar type III secretion system pore protein FliP [Actinoplanes oblitus]WIM96095.1 flagellar type III secretion system pore protein FliP [Actinoplanes oblitus]